MHRRAATILILVLVAGGCASHQSQYGGLAAGPPAPRPAEEPKSLLTLEQIPPVAVLPQARPATRPGVPPPAKSLALFAAARDATLDNQAFAAIDLLVQAIKLDPDSFELYRALGEARLTAARKPNQEELDAFEKALQLRPDDLRLQALIGAQYAALDQRDQALLHLRLATQTNAYADDDLAAAAVDLLLARLLQDQGYDRAALDQYLVLIHRLENPSYALRSDPELGSLAAAPQRLWLEVGYLREKHGQWAEALAVYQSLADGEPGNFEVQARVVRMLGNLGRTPEAVSRAADLVSRFGGSSESLALVKEVCSRRNVDVADALRQLRARRPNDTSLLLALAQVLSDRGQTTEARGLLESAMAAGKPQGNDRAIVSTLFDLYLRGGDIPAATRLLTAYLAAHPDALGEIEAWWEALLRPSRGNPLRLATLQKLDVEKSAGAAKLYLVWRLADLWHRDAVARGSLEQAVHISRPFGPAFRQLVVAYWGREDWDNVQKQKASEGLAALAEKGGDAPLAAEVRGLAALSDQRPAAAIAFYEQALTLGGSSPQLLLTYATALRAGKQDVKAEQLLWKMVGAQPQYDQAWEALFQFYLHPPVMEQARKVLAEWLAANPASISAQVIEADLDAEDGNVADAQTILNKLFVDHDDDPDVISALVSLGRRTGQLDSFIAQLEALRKREPTNGAAVEWLVEIYVAQGRTAEASRVLDQTRVSVAKDPDLLYRLAHLYDEVDQTSTTEAVLQQVVALAPNYAAACNDLGYSWAEQGKNLDRAEALIRVAVAQEPDNQSFLDSLGWVLYKRGRYAEAQTYFQLAIGPAARPDPVVLDHFGDVLYRLGRSEEAARQWQRSLSGLDRESEARLDLKELRLTLMHKLTQRQQGKPVNVAPVAAAK